MTQSGSNSTQMLKRTETNLAHGKAKWPSEKPKHQNEALNDSQN